MRAFSLAANVGAALLTRYIYLYGYDDLVRAGLANWVMRARNVVLVALFCSLVLEFVGGDARAASPADASTTRESAPP